MQESDSPTTHLKNAHAKFSVIEGLYEQQVRMLEVRNLGEIILGTISWL